MSLFIEGFFVGAATTCVLFNWINNKTEELSKRISEEIDEAHK